MFRTARKTWLSLSLLILAAAMLSMGSARATDKILYEKNSLYQYIVVSENTNTGIRYIHNNEVRLKQGGMDTRRPDLLVFEYYRMCLVSLAFLNNEPADILVVGLGAGAVPKYLNKHYPNARVDVVEIDPDVLDAARRFFYFRENGALNAQVNDGRMFIKRAKKKYDLVLLDAYRNGSIPFHLTTREFLDEVKKILKPGGVVASNILSERSNQFHDAMIVTYQGAFEHLYIFSGVQSENYMVVATNGKKAVRKKEAVERSKRVMKDKGLDVDLPTIAERYTYGSGVRDIKAEVLTDDFAPVDILKHRKSNRL